MKEKNPRQIQDNLRENYNLNQTTQGDPLLKKERDILIAYNILMESLHSILLWSNYYSKKVH